MPRQPRTIKPKQRKATTARRHISSPVNLQKQLDQRTRELMEAQKHLAELVQQQTATSEVLVGALRRNAAASMPLPDWFFVRCIFVRAYVSVWHKADMPVAMTNVRFRGQSGHRLRKMSTTTALGSSTIDQDVVRSAKRCLSLENAVETDGHVGNVGRHRSREVHMAWELTGQLIEACSCKALCPCYLGPAEPDQGWCSGALAFLIQKGQSENVDLSDRAVVWLIDLPKDFASGNGTARLYVACEKRWLSFCRS